MNYKPPGKYFDEFNIGDEYVTMGRTITEADITNFAGLSGNYDQLHTDIEFAKRGHFKERIAHGLIGLSFISGLIQRIGLIEGTVFAFLEIASWKYLAPLKIGDTVSVHIKISDKKEVKNNRGIVDFELRLINQRDEITQSGIWRIMMLGRKKEGISGL